MYFISQLLYSDGLFQEPIEGKRGPTGILALEEGLDIQGHVNLAG